MHKVHLFLILNQWRIRWPTYGAQGPTQSILHGREINPKYFLTYFDSDSEIEI